MGNSIKPYKVGTCKKCDQPNKKLIGGYCFEHPFCYQKRQEARSKEKAQIRANSGSTNDQNPKHDKSISELIKLATIVFNRFIVKRDLKGDYFNCISCGLNRHKSEAQCGHYRPVNYSALRFHEDNAHAECITCNCVDTNHLTGYRKNLVLKIGYVKVEWLDSHKIAEDFKWNKDDLLTIINKYK
jgi:hypothetical protein